MLNIILNSLEASSLIFYENIRCLLIATFPMSSTSEIQIYKLLLQMIQNFEHKDIMYRIQLPKMVATKCQATKDTLNIH